jgi:DNA-3-methyladenine glycosylase II
MPAKPLFWDAAVETLSRRDKVLRKIILGVPKAHLTRRNDAFTTLTRSIIGQQISVKAADAVWRRFLVATGAKLPASKARFPRVAAQTVAELEVETLRAAGLSQRKTEYIQDLAKHFLSGKLNPRKWRGMDDEALIEALSEVKGIGRWTAEMFLIFHEFRPDVFPIADIGLQRALRTYYGELEDAAPGAMMEFSERWKPYRSVATWYLWRALDATPVEY